MRYVCINANTNIKSEYTRIVNYADTDIEIIDRYIEENKIQTNDLLLELKESDPYEMNIDKLFRMRLVCIFKRFITFDKKTIPAYVNMKGYKNNLIGKKDELNYAIFENNNSAAKTTCHIVNYFEFSSPVEKYSPIIQFSQTADNLEDNELIGIFTDTVKEDGKQGIKYNVLSLSPQDFN